MKQITVKYEGLFDMILTSIPFGNHYEYSVKTNDLGHNPSDNSFWNQMDFMTPNLLKLLKPGRIAAIHVKDRILYGHQTPHGFMEVAPFSDETVMHFRKHGFMYMGRITIVTDVVRENNSTYRLGWSEQCKDSTKMGVGLPEYVMLFRKQPSDNENQRADEPVTKLKSIHFICSNCEHTTNDFKGFENVGSVKKECTNCNGTGEILAGNSKDDIIDCKKCTKGYVKNIEYLCPNCLQYNIFISATDFENGYSRGRWQVDAHSFWRSDGNRPLTQDELYNYEAHVKRMEVKEKRGNLPSSHMHKSPQSKHEAAWTDVNFMWGMNNFQSMKGIEKHICPLPFDIVNRLIKRYSNPKDIILEPFSGLGTVPYCAMKLKRLAYGIELNNQYFTDSLKYCKNMEIEAVQPTLFDLLDV